MIWLSIILLTVGVSLSAFFSGSETGFYRASRVRIVMDALDGDRLSKFLLLLTNRPALFVATALIGNNVANYVTSLAVVLGTRCLYPSDNAAAELVAPILMSPLLYVYGESLPKNLFYMAPNQLIKLASPLLMVFTLLFFPIALMLWGIANILEKILGESPDTVRLALARKELQQVLDEGEKAGILHHTQRLLAQNFFVEASKRIGSICVPITKTNTVTDETPYDSLLKVAMRQRQADIPVLKSGTHELLGYYRLVDMVLSTNKKLPELRPLRKVKSTELFGEVLLQMQAKRETLVQVVDYQDQTVGVLSIDQLTNPLLKGSLVKLRR